MDIFEKAIKKQVKFLPGAHICGVYKLHKAFFVETAGFEVVSFEAQAKMRAHLVARKN